MFFSSADYFVLCVDSQVIIHSLRNDGQPAIIEVPKIEKSPDGKNAPTEKHESKEQVVCGGISNSGHLLAVCDNNKRLIVWQLDKCSAHWQFKQEFKVARKCVKLLFTMDEKQILVGDRSGDVYIYDMNCLGNTEGSLLMGHLSMLLDLDLTCDGKYLVTCDRDEKIRVSSFPNSYNIHAYCLGHTEFVSSIAFMNENLLVSGSGDGTIRIWKYLTGNEILVYDCSVDVKINGRRTAVKQVIKLHDNLIAVSFYGFEEVLFYRIDCKDNYIISLINRINVSHGPIHKIVHFNNFIILVTANKNEMFVGCNINYESYEVQVTRNSEVIPLIKLLNNEKKFVDNFYQEIQVDEKSLEGLYKTWFNNVETYLEKKKERQEAKRLKSKHIK